MLNENKDQRKVVIVKELTSYGDPLDFSYKSLLELKEILKEKPRKGQRKPLILDDEKKDDKKKNLKDEDGKGNKDANNGDNQNETEGENPERQDGENKEEGEEKEKPKEKEDKSKPMEINLIPETHINNLINQHHVSLAAVTKNITGKVMDEAKVLQTKQVKVNLVTSGLLISYNEIRDLDFFKKYVDLVMYSPENLTWIDVSHNYLTKLTDEFKEFPNLTTLNIHCNFINELHELEKLEECYHLHNLTVHGNPIDTIPVFRLYIIGILPQIRKLDTVLVTKKERDNAMVWRESFGHGRTRKYPRVKTILKPPEREKQKQAEQTD